MLARPARRQLFIREIVKLVKAESYDGIDLDFENMRAEDRDRFTNFVGDLKRRLTPVGALLTLDVHPKTSEPGAWQGPISHDYAALARRADQLRVMAYDEHYAGGRDLQLSTAALHQVTLCLARDSADQHAAVLQHEDAVTVLAIGR